MIRFCFRRRGVILPSPFSGEIVPSLATAVRAVAMPPITTFADPKKLAAMVTAKMEWFAFVQDQFSQGFPLDDLERLPVR